MCDIQDEKEHWISDDKKETCANNMKSYKRRTKITSHISHKSLSAICSESVWKIIQ